MGRMYSVEFTEVSVAAQQDLFQIEALVVPAVIHAVFLSQTSDLGDAESEGLSILIRRFTDVVTDDRVANALDGGDATQNADLAINETTELVGGTGEVLHSEAWNILTPFVYLPTPELRPIVQIGNGLAINLNTTPGTALIMSGTMYFEEFGN